MNTSPEALLHIDHAIVHLRPEENRVHVVGKINVPEHEPEILFPFQIRQGDLSLNELKLNGELAAPEIRVVETLTFPHPAEGNVVMLLNGIIGSFLSVMLKWASM